MNMSDYTKPKPVGSIDWNDPHLESLLRKTESWSLDNRGAFTPISVEVHVGWGASSGKPATLVFERDGLMVLEANFILPQGEQVRVDRYQGGMQRSIWGLVAEGRPGNRAEDKANGIHIYWIHSR